MTSIKLKNLTTEQTSELLPENLIFLGYRGSIAHGMYTPSSNPDSIDDKDIMGVYIAPIEHYIGFGSSDVKEKFIGEWDSVCYELKKFVQLLLKSNPNVMSLLWLPKHHIIFNSPLAERLVENRNLFITKAAYHSFTGYAYGQLKRMTHFNNDARKEMITLEDKLSSCHIDFDLLNATQQQLDSNKGLKEAIERYRFLKNKYYGGGYMGKKRKELVTKFGFDCKNGSHLIRLLKMGIEFLTDGELHVERNDKEQLLAIKYGEWSLEKVTTEADRLFKLAEEAYIRSTLSAEPNRKAAELLCMELIADYHGWNLK